MKHLVRGFCAAVVFLSAAHAAGAEIEPLPGTLPLTFSGDAAAQMVQGIDRYLDRLLALTVSNRQASVSTPSWLGSAETNRARLRHILGAVDQRDPVQMRLTALVPAQPTTGLTAVGHGPGYQVLAVVWNVFRGVEGEGLLLQPAAQARADVVALPDCDWTPEQLAGLQPGIPQEWQFARRLAEGGCRVLVPCLIDRSDTFAGNPGVRHVRHSQRETLWRASYEMGRTLAGYEVQKVLAAADWLEATRQGGSGPDAKVPKDSHSLGIVGYGEGGLVAFYAAAIEPRFCVAAISGYFAPRERLHEEPIYRNVWSLLDRFGDAEIARLILPRPLWIECGKYPEATHSDEHGGAPGRLWQPTFEEVSREVRRVAPGTNLPLGLIDANGSVGSVALLTRFCAGLHPRLSVSPNLAAPPELTGPLPDSAARQRRQYTQVLEDTQWLMRESEYTRRDFWKRANFKSVDSFTNSAQWYRNHFQEEITGRLPKPSLPPAPRSRFLYETNGYRGYEVMLDVHPDVFAFGTLLVPLRLKPAERRPVVVCQHGLEGRPRDVADPTIENAAYHRYACRLAERGFVVFAPQNPYIGGTRFRQVLHKAQPLGLTLWSFIVRQHEVITDWLASLAFVDPRRIAFYGLSYGGKTAMRVPVLVERYCLSICSADYNEWIWKNVSARAPYSYLWTSEYDMPEFNLGNTFNYAELSWLIFPRPFMVERGHDDGVAPDEWVAYEYAKTRRHYVKLGLADRTAIEFFDGPHTINGQGTFDFLHRHLEWPKP